MAKKIVTENAYDVKSEIEKIRGQQHWANEFTGYDHSITPEEKERWEEKSKKFWERLKIKK